MNRGRYLYALCWDLEANYRLEQSYRAYAKTGAVNIRDYCYRQHVVEMAGIKHYFFGFIYFQLLRAFNRSRKWLVVDYSITNAVCPRVSLSLIDQSNGVAKIVSRFLCRKTQYSITLALNDTCIENIRLYKEIATHFIKLHGKYELIANGLTLLKYVPAKHEEILLSTIESE